MIDGIDKFEHFTSTESGAALIGGGTGAAVGIVLAHQLDLATTSASSNFGNVAYSFDHASATAASDTQTYQAVEPAGAHTVKAPVDYKELGVDLLGIPALGVFVFTAAAYAVRRRHYNSRVEFAARMCAYKLEHYLFSLSNKQES